MRTRAFAGALAGLVGAAALRAPASAAAPFERLPDRWGMALSSGQSYSPTGQVRYQTVSLVRDWDYSRAWGHEAPPALRFKAEATAGLANVPELRFLGSGNIMAVRYLDPWVGPRFRPYVEAGIGLIYTDFRVEGQGLRFNFNPQVGVGVEWVLGPERSGFVALRGHHVSNGGLHPDNTGINSLVLTAGMLF